MAINRKVFSVGMFFAGATVMFLVWGFSTGWKFTSTPASLAGKDCTLTGGGKGKTDVNGVCKAA